MNKYTLQREDTLLLVIDIQTKLIHAIFNKEELLKNTSTLLEMAKAYEIPSLYTEQYPKGLGLTDEAILEELKERDSFLLEKTSYDAYLPELIEAIKKTGRKKVILVGAEAHICVFQTLRSLLANGYEVFVPFDAVGSRSKKNWKNALMNFREMGAFVSNTESILFDMIKDAKDPHFKALQKLIM